MTARNKEEDHNFEEILEKVPFSGWAKEELSTARYVTAGFAEAIHDRAIPELLEVRGQISALQAHPELPKLVARYADSITTACGLVKLPKINEEQVTLALKHMPWHSSQVSEIVSFLSGKGQWYS